MSNSQIEVLTSGNEKEAREALQVFENARQFFSTANPFSTALTMPVRVFAFQSKEEYTPYRLNDSAFGHFLHSGEVDYIVLEDVKPEHYEAALHEYTHYVVRQAGLHLPTWLNEGLADLYSSMEPVGTKTAVGRLLPGRIAAWESKPALGLRALFAATPDSPYYYENDRLTMFYAQSWALTHMLALDRKYAARFPDFLKNVSSGMSSADALLQVYAKSLEQVESDLKQYRPRMAANTAVFDVRVGGALAEPQVRRLSDEEKRFALADLLAAHPATARAALQAFTELAKQNPDNPSISERMGAAAWSLGRTDDARAYFARAVEHGSRNAEMIYRYAVLQKQAGALPQEIMNLFERVLELSPGFDDARFQLGLLQFNGKRFEAAAQSLSKLKTIKKSWAYAYYSAMAYCDIQFSHLEEARMLGEKAKLSAITPAEESQADRLLLYLQARVSGTGRETMLASAGRRQDSEKGVQLPRNGAANLSN